MQTWSYRFEVFEVDTEEEGAAKLDELGAQGWECFAIESRPNGFVKRQLRCWLKRSGRPIDPGQAELA